MDKYFGYLILLLTVVWVLFLVASSTIALVVLPALDSSRVDYLVSIARTFIGTLVFAAWAFIWQKLTELWLYKVLLRGE